MLSANTCKSSRSLLDELRFLTLDVPPPPDIAEVVAPEETTAAFATLQGFVRLPPFFSRIPQLTRSFDYLESHSSQLR